MKSPVNTGGRASDFTVRLCDLSKIRLAAANPEKPDPISTAQEQVRTTINLLSKTRTDNEDNKTEIVQKLESARKLVSKLHVVA